MELVDAAGISRFVGGVQFDAKGDGTSLREAVYKMQMAGF
jgi:hypothetical protein